MQNFDINLMERQTDGLNNQPTNQQNEKNYIPPDIAYGGGL